MNQSLKVKFPLYTSLTSLLLLITISPPAHATVFSGGDGTSDNPYQISTATQLLMIGEEQYQDKSFMLINDIDLDLSITGLLPFTEPIIPEFNGTLDGLEHSIFNLTIAYASSGCGFIGTLNQQGQLSNLHMRDIVILGSSSSVGALAGINYGSIYNCSATGTISSAGSAGGLVGVNQGTMISCNAACYIWSSSYYCGGLVGNNYGTIYLSYAESSVISTGNYTGGFIGRNNATGVVICSYTNSYVSGDYYDIGGFVGENAGSIINCYSTGEVYGTSSYYTGGFAGDAYSSGSIYNCFWDVQTSGITDSDGGTGLTTSEMQSLSTFQDAGWDFVGNTTLGTKDIWIMPTEGGYPELVCFLPDYDRPQLAGQGTPENPFEISTAEELGALSHYPPNSSIKLIGDIDLSEITWGNCPLLVFSGTLDGRGHEIQHLTIDNESGAGLIYVLTESGLIKDLQLTDTQIQGYNYVGGLVALNKGLLHECMIDGSISCNYYGGGLVGSNQGFISSCASVTSTSGERYLGGLIGSNTGHVINSYALGTASGYSYIGGLIGTSSSNTSVAICYAACNISASYSSGIGGLIGYNSGWVDKSFWDVQTSGLTQSAGGIGLNSNQLKTPETYIQAGWDLTEEWTNGTANIWTINSADGYPELTCFSDSTNLHSLAGYGTESNPYLIETVEDLGAINHYDSESTYELIADINMIDIVWSNAPIQVFGGTFKGMGHRISGLTIDGSSNIGLFGTVLDQGSIDQTIIEDVLILGYTNLGCLAGSNLGTITSCQSDGILAGNSCVGGIVGTNTGTISDCSADVILSGNSSVNEIAGSDASSSSTR